MTAGKVDNMVGEVLLDYLVLSEIVHGAYTRKAIVERLGQSADEHLEELLAQKYLVVKGESLVITEKGYERCLAYDKLIDRLCPGNN